MAVCKRQFAFEVRPAQHTYRQWTHLPPDVKKAGKVVEKIPLLLHVSSVSDLPRGIRKKVVEIRRRILIPNRSHGPADRQKAGRRRGGEERRGATRRELRTRKAKTSNASEERRKENHAAAMAWIYMKIREFGDDDFCERFFSAFPSGSSTFDVASRRLVCWRRDKGAAARCSFGVCSFTRATPICVI